MHELPLSMGPHDAGGDTEGYGPIDTVDHGMTHWQKHANAVRMCVSNKRIATLDELRRAVEGLGRHYYELGYFERQTESLAIVLAEKGLVTDAEREAKMADVRARFDVPTIDLPEDHDHDGKPIQEDDTGGPPVEHHVINLAIQELLEQKGLITADDIRDLIEKFDGDYPNRGPKVVARAWTDPAFKAALLEDATKAIIGMGIDLDPSVEIIAIENTPDVHNLVVCTLCSCYPRTLMGQPPTWYKSRSYRSRAVHEPRAVLREFGSHLPDDVTVQVHDSNADMRYIVIPMRPDGTDGWSEARLEGIITRDCLVGATVPKII